MTNEASPQTDEKTPPTEMMSHRTASKRSAFWRIYLISFLWDNPPWRMEEKANKFLAKT